MSLMPLSLVFLIFGIVSIIFVKPEPPKENCTDKERTRQIIFNEYFRGVMSVGILLTIAGFIGFTFSILK